jgi:hypothetical protein
LSFVTHFPPLGGLSRSTHGPLSSGGACGMRRVCMPRVGAGTALGSDAPTTFSLHLPAPFAPSTDLPWFRAGFAVSGILVCGHLNWFNAMMGHAPLALGLIDRETTACVVRGGGAGSPAIRKNLPILPCCTCLAPPSLRGWLVGFWLVQNCTTVHCHRLCVTRGGDGDEPLPTSMCRPLNSRAKFSAVTVW